MERGLPHGRAMSHQELLLTLALIQIMQRLRQPRFPRVTLPAAQRQRPAGGTELPGRTPAVPSVALPSPPSVAPTTVPGATASALPVSTPAAGRPLSRGSMLPPMRASQSLPLGRQGTDAGWALRRHSRVPHGGQRSTDFVCEAEGRPVGGVRVNPSGREAIHIENLSVSEPFRGQGLGARLLGTALQLGQRWGRSKAWLEADDTGSGRLLAWYQRLGFQLAGKGPHGRPVLEARVAHALPVIRRQCDTQVGGQPSFTFRAVPASHAARIYP